MRESRYDLLQSCERKLQTIRHLCEVICDVMKGKWMKFEFSDYLYGELQSVQNIHEDLKCVTQIRDAVKQAVNTAQQTQVCTTVFNMAYPFNSLQLQGL